MSARVLQLSDCHLFADTTQCLKGCSPYAGLEAVLLLLLRTRFADADRLIFTGDLAHDELLPTYHVLRALLGDWLPRCRFLPGNHDHRAAMREVLPNLAGAGEEAITFTEELAGWRLIGLDTQVPGQSYGRIEPDQCAWLKEQLHAHRTQPTILFLHHPPIAVDSAWLDEIGLQQPERFAEVVAAFPQVRSMGTGHVHQEFEGRLGQLPVFSVPSTAVQFRPRTAQLEMDPVAPGLRCFELSGNDFRTQVVRVPEFRYTPET